LRFDELPGWGKLSRQRVGRSRIRGRKVCPHPQQLAEP